MNVDSLSFGAARDSSLQQQHLHGLREEAVELAGRDLPDGAVLSSLLEGHHHLARLGPRRRHVLYQDLVGGGRGGGGAGLVGSFFF